MDKIDLTTDMILSELSLIEKHLGYTSMDFYSPQDSILTDLISIQKEASRMMRFVGLVGYTPVITFTNTEEFEAGNIKLDDSKDVFIEISNKYRYRAEQVLAIMAHEICHKVLYINNLYYPNIRIKNEVLTDLATIYVGFGKLTLNGHYLYFKTTEKKRDYEGEKEIITHHKDLIGYLTSPTYASAYSLVCSRFNISEKDKYYGLSGNAQGYLNAVVPVFEIPITTKDIKETLKESQSIEAATTNSIVVLEEYIKYLRKRLKERHDTLYSDFNSQCTYTDEDLAKFQFSAQQLIYKYRNNKSYTFLKINSSLLKAISLFKANDEITLDDNELEIDLRAMTCPRCGYVDTSYLKENRTAFVKCPKCKHIFLWDGIMHHQESNQIDSKDASTTKSKESWTSKIFKRRKK